MTSLSTPLLVQKLSKFENEKYLRAHPELGVMVQQFLVHVLETRPESIEDAAIQFFVKTTTTTTSRTGTAAAAAAAIGGSQAEAETPQ